MVDELRLQQRRFGTLSESSSEDAESCSNHEDSGRDLDDDVNAHKVTKSRKQNIRALREDFEDDPKLYGIRRSVRSRKGPSSFEPISGLDRHPVSRRRISSESESDDDSSDSSYGTSKRGNERSLRTRKRRVNYKSAFIEEIDTESNEYGRVRPSSTAQYASQSTARNQPLFQKPRGPLMRTSAHTSDRLQMWRDGESVHYDHQETLSDEGLDSATEDFKQNQMTHGEVDEEVDVIEEVLNHAVRRVGATGNPTTLYNCRLEHDPNEGFDPSVEKGELQYLIKWRSWSHIHSTWETEASLTNPDRGSAVEGLKRLAVYRELLAERQRREKNASQDDLDVMAYEDERNEMLLAEKMDVDRIVAHSRDKEQGSFDYLIKWRRLEYRFCTWESGQVVTALYKKAVETYEHRCNSTALPNSRHEALRSRPKFVRLLEQPDYLAEGNPDLKLRDYQLEGLNWIAHAWTRGNSVILADEMGLGKTVQAVSFLSYLFHTHGLCGPFLIVVPLSTISNWQYEMDLWAPQMNTITYVGDHISRQFIREHEWSASGAAGGRRQQLLKFNVCMTTYELLLKDKSWLGQVSWAALIVDEAHRLKNDASQLYKSLFEFNTNTRLLITGTPLQNSLKELWALLHFLMPSHFDDWEKFEANYGLQGQNSDVNSYDAIRKLHHVLGPFLIRRAKKDVENSLPAKTEQILRVELSNKQSTIYRLILAKNYDGLMKVTNGHRASFINIVMELKKCCNHTNLIAPPTDEELPRFDREQHLREILKGSGKLMLLDKLLLKLKSQDHRVLIFSQMVRMLDIIADYLVLRGWSFQRLDGSIRGELRKQSIDHFNAEGSTDFCFLLSTRAGGLGVNLATADTVIIFDSDWNPQNDIQAQARAHRIGQTKQVSVYRLIVKDSVEEKIIESATRKMLLDHLVIQRMESGGRRGSNRADAKDQLLTEILRHGAEGLFARNDEEAAEKEVDIDDILTRAETRDADSSEDMLNPANALLSTFNVVKLDILEQDDIKPVQMKSSGRPTKSWSEIIPAELCDQVKNAENKQSLLDLELGPRRRRKVKTFQAGGENYERSTDSDGGESTTNGKPVNKFSDKEIRALVKAMKRFARPLERIDAIAAEAELPDRTSNEVKGVVEAVLKGCQFAMESLSKETEDPSEGQSKQKGPIFYYGKVAVAAKHLLQSLNDLEVLYKCLPTSSMEDRLNYELPFFPKYVTWSCPWDTKDDVRLLVGVYEHGYDNWEAIKLDADLGLGSKILPISANERPQVNHLRTRVDYLLKMLMKSCEKSDEADKKEHRSKNKDSSSDLTSLSSKKHKKRAAAVVKRNDASKSGTSVPKSAEFVDSDDSSMNSDSENDLLSTIKATSNDSIKCPEINSEGPRDVSSERKRKKKPHNDEPLHFTANRVPVSISKADEEEFHQMQGVIFSECKKKFRPIKKLFKHLEYLESAGDIESDLYDEVILGIGDHIHSVTKELENRDNRHAWRQLYWEFVQIFSENDPAILQQIYSNALKRVRKAHKRDKKRQNEEKDEYFHEPKRRRDFSYSSNYNNNNNSINHMGTPASTPTSVSDGSGTHSQWSSSKHRHREKHSSSSSNRHADRHPPSPLGNNRDFLYQSPLNESYYSRRNIDNDRGWSNRDRDRSRHRRANGLQGNSRGFSNDRNNDRFDNAFNRPVGIGFSGYKNNRTFSHPPFSHPTSTNGPTNALITSSSIPFREPPPWYNFSTSTTVFSPSVPSASIIPPAPATTSRDPRLISSANQ